MERGGTGWNLLESTGTEWNQKVCKGANNHVCFTLTKKLIVRLVHVGRAALICTAGGAADEGSGGNRRILRHRKGPDRVHLRGSEQGVQKEM